jgi:hypothetical protein
MFDFDKNNINFIGYSGLFVLHEEISNEFELVIETNKCSLDMNTCAKYTNFRIEKMCEKFESKGPFYVSISAAITPPIHCPIKPGNYTLGKTRIDLSPIKALNIDGFIWVSKFKFVSTNSTTKLKRIILCYNTEVKIVKVRNRSG